MKALICLLALGLSGCASLTNIVQKAPASSFDKVQLTLTIGPYTSDTTLLGGIYAPATKTLTLKTGTDSTTFMGYGTKVDVENLSINPVAPPVP